MFNAIFVNPWVYDFTYFNLWEKPLGLLTLASYFIERGTASVGFIDCLDERLKKTADMESGAGKFTGVITSKPGALKYIPRNYYRFGINEPEFVKKLHIAAEGFDNGKPTVVLITCMMTYWYQGAFEVAKAVRLALPGAKIAVGGIYARLMPEHAERSGLFDHIERSHEPPLIYGNILKLTGAEAGGCDKTSLRYFKTIETNKNYTLNNSNLIYSNLHFEQLAFRKQFFIKVDTAGLKGGTPLYELLPELNNSAATATSEGCPYSCTYCASSRLYPKYSPRDLSKIEADMIYFKKTLAVDNVAFYDDALLYKKEDFFYKWAEKIITEGLKLRFHLPNAVHAAMIDEKCADTMKKVGFETIRLGYEFFDGDAQQESGGKVSNAALENSIKNLKKAGFDSSDIGIYTIFGHPRTKLDEIHRAVEFVIKCGAVPNITLYSPIPGTPDAEAVFSERPEFLEEPLLQNKAAFFELYGKTSAAEYYKLKNDIQTLMKMN